MVRFNSPIKATIEEDSKVTGRKFRRVILGFQRSAGDFKNEKNQTVVFDNVSVYMADAYFEYYDSNRNIYSEGFLKGSSKKPAMEVVKVSITDFEDVFGITFEEFSSEFYTKYQFHPASVLGDVDDFGKTVVIRVDIIERSVYDFMNSATETGLRVEGAE